MGNIVTYAEQMLAPFSSEPFHSVDSLILSWISYMHLPSSLSDVHSWKGVRFADLFRAEYFEELFRRVWDTDSSRRLFTAMAASPRFRDIRVMGYTERIDKKEEKQFAAVSFQLNDDLCYVAFRGTDSTLVGWKEDFNMAFQYPVPAQEDARIYLEETACHCTGQMMTGGHSKGGNLAVYAAANASPAVQERILHAYSHDGPGFLDTVLQSEPFVAIRDKIDKTLPQSSLVGMLLEQQENYQIVESNRFSFWQHDPFSWVVEGNCFHFIKELTPDARYFDHTLNEWVRSMSIPERERFVDSLFGLIDTEHIDSVDQLRAERQKSIPSILRAASQMDADTKGFLTQTVRALLSLSIRNVPELLKK